MAQEHEKIISKTVFAYLKCMNNRSFSLLLQYEAFYLRAQRVAVGIA